VAYENLDSHMTKSASAKIVVENQLFMGKLMINDGLG
jgi:hypothetical protein